jgi:hypothetical protein
VKTVEEYLRHALECDALARKVVSPEQREMIIHMAETWRMMARQRRTIILNGPAPADRAPDTPQDGATSMPATALASA